MGDREVLLGRSLTIVGIIGILGMVALAAMGSFLVEKVAHSDPGATLGKEIAYIFASQIADPAALRVYAVDGETEAEAGLLFVYSPAPHLTGDPRRLDWHLSRVSEFVFGREEGARLTFLEFSLLVPDGRTVTRRVTREPIATVLPAR